IPLVNVGELPEMDPYEEVAQQGQATPLSPAYVPDPIELDEHVPVYIPEPEHPEYHVPSDDDIQVKDQPYADDASPTAESPGYIADLNLIEEDNDEDSIDYPDEPEDDEEDDDEDPKEDPSQEHEPEDEDEDPEEDPNDEHEPEDEDTKEEEPSDGSDETKPFEKDETAVTPPSPRHRGARISVRPQTPWQLLPRHLLMHLAAMIRMRDNIPEEDMPPWRRFVLTDLPPGCDVAKSFVAAARPPRGQYDFFGTVKAGQGLIRSPGHDARTIARAASRGCCYQAQVHRRESKDFYTQILDARTDRRDIRLEIDVVRGQRTTYKTELHESAEDFAVRQMMRTQALKAIARIDTVEDAGSSC
ncbi:hypothetical protein Tco_1129934, partial [Tanacetum coccineum]